MNLLSHKAGTTSTAVNVTHTVGEGLILDVPAESRRWLLKHLNCVWRKSVFIVLVCTSKTGAVVRITHRRELITGLRWPELLSELRSTAAAKLRSLNH